MVLGGFLAGWRGGLGSMTAGVVGWFVLAGRRRVRSATTTELGLGWRHQQQRAMLLRRLRDGDLCWWCNLPLRKDAQRNWDGLPLAADHSQARSLGGSLADRVLHYTCNSQRGNGSRDESRPSLTGAAVSREEPGADLAMDW